MRQHRHIYSFLLAALILVPPAACDQNADAPTPDPATPELPEFQVATVLNSPELVEISGIQAAPNNVFFIFNDSGGPVVHVIDGNWKHGGRITLEEARNKDWEDITRVPGNDGPLLVLGDIGDNDGGRKTVQLYFIDEPEPLADGRWPESVPFIKRLKVHYPDGPRDCEAMAWDPVSNMILFLTKRDRPPHLYGLPLDEALSGTNVELEFLAKVPTFRPPTPVDIVRHPKRGDFISQPTGLDISPDGRIAAVITYRSLYLYFRETRESWSDAFQRKPIEILGPPRLHDEAVTFSLDQQAVYVSTEGRPAPVYRLELQKISELQKLGGLAEPESSEPAPSGE